MKILVLAVPIGAGHLKAATAVTDAIKTIDPSVEVRIEDCFTWVFPLYGYAYCKIYDFGQLRSHRLLKMLYGGMGVKTGTDRLLVWFHRKSAYRFRKLLRAYNPDYVICAHFSPAYYAARYKTEFSYRIGVVVTDYFVHPHWVNASVDHYFIPHESLAASLIGLGAPATRIFPLGLPVNPVLEKPIDREAGRRRFGIDPGRISAVVMGSRVFGGEWFEIVRMIVDFDYDLFVLCGDNKEAMRRIKGLNGKARLTVLGMVEKVYELLAVGDILITKAGGITSTEATKIAPCLLFANSIPGLEDRNEEFFIRHGAALKITPTNAGPTIRDLLADPARMVAMRQNLSRLAKTDSARNIARVILRESQPV